MKKVFVSFILLMCFASFSSYGQCKRFLKKVDVTAMRNYSYCNTSKVAKMYKGDEVALQYSVQSNKRYRIMRVAKEYLGIVTLSIQDANGKPLGIPSENTIQPYWDVMVENDQTIQVQLTVEKPDKLTEINTAACIAVLFGSMELEELVVNQ